MRRPAYPTSLVRAPPFDNNDDGDDDKSRSLSLHCFARMPNVSFGDGGSALDHKKRAELCPQPPAARARRTSHVYLPACVGMMLSPKLTSPPIQSVVHFQFHPPPLPKELQVQSKQLIE